MPDVAAIEVDALVVRHGEITAVDGVSFRVERGELVALLGPNGAGKTSTVETIEGYRRPGGGSVRVLGLDPVAEHAAVVRRLGVMLQGGGVYPGLRAGEAVRLFAAYHDAPAADADALLERVGLRPRARSTWRQLSGGEQQRLSLALALVGRPDVVVLDEPTAGVDVGGRQVVREILRELTDQGVGVLLTTHELDEAERVADRVLVVDRGRIVGAGTPEELRSAGADEIRFGAPPGLDVAPLASALGAPVEEVARGEYLVHAPPEPRTVAAVTAWLAEHDLPLADLRAGRQRLEDVVLRLTRDDGGRR